MDFRIDKTSDIPVRQQLAEQIIFAIATERLKSFVAEHLVHTPTVIAKS